MPPPTPEHPRARTTRPATLLFITLILTGCANDAGHHASDSWTWTQRDADRTDEIGRADGWTQDQQLTTNKRQIGGQWHGNLPADTPFTLRFDATTNISVEFRIRTSDNAAASGRCDWGEETGEKDVALGRARMRNNATSCEIVFTPATPLQDTDGPTLRWETRGPATGTWTLRFQAER